MTATPADIGTQISRCAVCKIDRKGRFILADHEAERLFGLSEVKLFGQPFVEFLDPADREAVNHMTTNRNPYETVYDSARMTIIDATGYRIPATVVLSVNFGGGNPANYQIVIVREDQELPRQEIADQTDTWRALVEFLNSCEAGACDLNHLVEQLLTASGARAVTIFEADPDSGEPLASAGNRLADAADDSDGPNEIRASFRLPDSRLGLALFEVGLVQPSDDEDQIRQRSELAASLLHLYLPPLGFQSQDSSQSLPGLELIDRMDVAFLRLRADQSSTCYGSALERLLGAADTPDDADGIIKMIADLGHKKTARKLADYLKLSAEHDHCPDFQTILKGVAGEPVSLRVQRMDDKASAPNWLLMLAPEYPGLYADSISSTLLTAYTGLLSDALDAAHDACEELEHEFGSKDEKAGQARLSGTSHNLDQALEIVGLLEKLCKLAGRPDKIQPTDLTLVVDHGLKQVGLQYPNRQLKVARQNLTRVPAQRKHLMAAVESILLWWAAASNLIESSAKITAECSQETCLLTFDFAALDIPTRSLQKLFQPHYNLPEPGSQPASLARCNLSLVKEITRQFNGLVRAGRGPKGATRIELTFPTK